MQTPSSLCQVLYLNSAVTWPGAGFHNWWLYWMLTTCFPAAPFDSEEALAALSRLGMQSIIGQESILQSARYVAELGLQDPDQAHERVSAHASIFPNSPCIVHDISIFIRVRGLQLYICPIKMQSC